MSNKTSVKYMIPVLILSVLAGCGAVDTPENTAESNVRNFCRWLDDGEFELASAMVAEDAQDELQSMIYSWDELVVRMDAFEPEKETEKVMEEFGSAGRKLQIENCDIEKTGEDTFEVSLDLLDTESVYKTFGDLAPTNEINAETLEELQKNEGVNKAYNYAYSVIYTYLRDNLDKFKENSTYQRKVYDMTVEKSGEGWIITEISEN